MKQIMQCGHFAPLSLSLPLLILSPSFSHGFPERRGAEKGEALLSDLSV